MQFVFICYKQSTAEDYALSLRKGLQEFQVNAFLDIVDIPKRFKDTDKWWEHRDQAIRDCGIFLMIVTRGFDTSEEIRKEITLAFNENREFMCLRRRNLPADLPIVLLNRHINLRDYQQIPFETRGELPRSVLDNLIAPKQEMAEKTPLRIKQPPTGEKPRFPLVHFNITQAVQFNPNIKRKLPNVGFNMRSWNDTPLRAKVEAKVSLGDEDLGLVKGSKRGGKYMGYYNGNTLWNLNPYTIVFGNFSVPKKCTETNETLRIEVKVTLSDTEGTQHKLLPVSWAFVRDKNNWFYEPSGDC